MFKNKFIAFKNQCLDFSSDCVIHGIETISMEEFKNKTINENLALGSNVFYNWSDKNLYNGDYYCGYIADYKLTDKNISFFTQKPLSKKDLTTLNKIPIGGVFTFTFIPELRLPKNIKDINKYNILNLKKSYQIKNIKIYEDQKVNSIILSIINNYKEKRFKEKI